MTNYKMNPKGNVPSDKSTGAGKKGVSLVDNRKKNPVQLKENNTGLPDQLKSGIENLSGQSMDDVKVHYNSDKPAQLNAHAYAQGTNIHLASGQEKHLPHEAWHVVQQKQGRVKATKQLKSKVAINDDETLEKEADMMGAKALQMKQTNSTVSEPTKVNSSAAIVQGVFLPDARKNVAEDRSTLIKEYHKAEKNGNERDKAAIMAAQRGTGKTPTLIPMGYTEDGQFEADVGLYGMAEAMLLHEIQGKPGWRLGLTLFEHSDMYFAEEFVKLFHHNGNPSVPLKFLIKMKEKGALTTYKKTYRDTSYGANGVIYYFRVKGTAYDLGEWHVHWEAGKKAGNPGWKKGKNGAKTATGDEMKALLGSLWGHT